MSQNVNHSETPSPKGKDSTILLILVGLLILLFIIVRLGDTDEPLQPADNAAEVETERSGESAEAADTATTGEPIAQSKEAQMAEPQTKEVGQAAATEGAPAKIAAAESEPAPVKRTSGAEEKAPSVADQPEPASELAARGSIRTPPPRPAAQQGNPPMPGSHSFDSFTPPPGWGMQRAPDGSVYLTPPAN